MKFLFHTIIKFDGVPVYYNILKNGDHYFVQILYNPQNVSEAKNFTVRKEAEEWKSSVAMTERQVDELGENIENHLRTK